jgi:two-component system LytT family response regulator
MYYSKLAIKTTKGVDLVSYDDILYCMAEGRYTRIFMVNGKEYLLTKVLKEIEHALPDEDFFRCHKSYLINLNYITNFERSEERFIILDHNKKISLSKRKQYIFSRRIKNIVNEI